VITRLSGRLIAGWIAALLWLTGTLLTWSGFANGGAIGRWSFGLLLFAAGTGIFWRQHWARWLALGACFLAIAGACVVPVLLLLAVPYQGQFDGSMRVNILWSMAAFAIGAIGYMGLAYFRSEQACLDFAGGNLAARGALSGETSSAVVMSAGVWVVLIVVAEIFGLGAPTWLFAHVRRDAPGPAHAASRVIEFTWFEVFRDPAKGVGNSPSDVKFRVLPDLIPLGVCYRDGPLGRVVDLVYANVGAGSSYHTFRFEIRRNPDGPPSRRGLELAVPGPDTLLTARLGKDTPELSGSTWVDLDPESRIVESDEQNNRARIVIPRDPDGSIASPPCEAVRLRILPEGGSTKTAATIAPPPALPDLVPLGLCSRGNVNIGVQFTNRGGHASGLYQISQTKTGSALQLVDKTYLSVPEPYRAMSFNVGPVWLLVGKRGQSADVAVKLDYNNAIRESNEWNNVTSARVTRLADGSLDLPDCEALATHAADPNWIDPGPLRQDPVPHGSSAARLPDLVPLGACLSSGDGDGDAKLRVYFANSGMFSNPAVFAVVVRHVGGMSMQTAIRARDLKPGYVWSEYFDVEPAAGKTLILEIDPHDDVDELDEANNSLSLRFESLANGSVDLPECPKNLARVREWTNMMLSRQGN